MKKLFVLLLFIPMSFYGQHPAVEAGNKWVEKHGAEMLNDYIENRLIATWI